MPRYGDEFKRNILADLAGLTGRERAETIARLTAQWGISKQAISAWARKAGQRDDGTVRRDRGRSQVTAKETTVIAATLLTAKRSDGRLPMHTKEAARVLVETGGLETEVSYSTLCRELRRQGLSKAHLRERPPHRSRAYPHPNWEWQIDASNCLQYFFDAGGLGERDIAMQLHRNHPAEFRKIRKQLLRYGVIDPYSGCFVFRYYYETGERARDFLDLLIDAWQPPERWNHWRTPHPAFQFHGVPSRIVADKGAFAKSDMVRQFLKQCGVDLITHLPGRPWAKAYVENEMNQIEQFEVWLKLQTPPDLETVNRWAWEWACRKNCEAAYRAKTDPNGRTRIQRWLTITQEQLQVPAPVDALWSILRDGRARRRVEKNGRVEHRGRWYSVPDTDCWGRWVEVAFNPLTYPDLDVTWRDQEDGRVRAVWRLKKLDVDAGGFLSDSVAPGTYRRPAMTTTQRAMAGLEQAATERYGVSWKGTGDKRIAVRPALGQHKTEIFGQGRDAEAVEGLATLPKAGTPHTVKDPAAERRLTLIELLQAVRNALGRPLTGNENAQIRTGWPEGCRAAEMDAVLDACAGVRKEDGDDEQDQRAASLA
jgi:hypothetical protein